MKTITFIILLLLLYSCNQTVQETKTTNSTKTDSNATAASRDTSIKPIEQSATLTGCQTIVFEILTTSARYKEITDGLTERIVKNGGTSYGYMLEGSPEPEKDSAQAYSKTYDYSLHESYPDRQPVIARFTFDRAARQLYEYDAASDTLVPIAFNKQLLTQLDKGCK